MAESEARSLWRALNVDISRISNISGGHYQEYQLALLEPRPIQ